MYLKSYLEERKLSCKIIDLKGPDTPDYIEKYMLQIEYELLNNPTRFVGLSAFHTDYPMIKRLGELVKKTQPHTKLIVGNAHATIDPEDFIYKGSDFDIAVLGEGEAVCEEIAFWDYRKTKGIAYWDALCGLYKTEPREFIDISDIKMPDYDDIDMDYYTKVQKQVLRRLYISLMPVFAGRGCPFNCNFCAANIIWKANKGKPCRIRNVEHVVDEIKYLIREYNIDGFYLYDDMFGMDKKWTEEWFIEKAKFKEVPYACQTRVDMVNEDLIKKLKDTGCIQIDFGVETGSQRMLDKVNKKITVAQIRNAFDLCKKYDIRSFACMLINLPGETEQDLIDSHKVFKEINPSAGVILSVTTPYPGSEIYKYCDPPLKRDEYRYLLNHRLNPTKRFRLAKHDLDLEKIFHQWNRDFNITPMFERMWAMKPFQPLYWKAVLKSKRKLEYLKCWAKDIPKTMLIYLSHKFNFYKTLKKIQYKKDCKY